MTPYLLIGAGGHAATIIEIASAQGFSLAAYCDPQPCSWADAKSIKRVDEANVASVIKEIPHVVIGYVGLRCEKLAQRLAQIEHYQKLGVKLPAIMHSSAIISPSAVIEDGAHIMAGAIINAGAHIGAGSVINSGAIIEHHAHIGAGCHIAPRACVLGDARVGAASFIGAGSTIIQGQRVPEGSFIKAHTLYNVAHAS